jgi:hypothetical protein
MRGVSSVAGAIAIAAVFSGDCGRASAQPIEGNGAPTLLFFGGADLWTNGSFTHGGLLWARNGLDAEGFVFKVLIGGGSYRYHSGALANAEVTGRQFTAFAMPGWRFQRGGFTVTLLAGLDVQHHWLSPYDPGSDLHGTKAGIRGAIELWFEPTSATMVAADAAVSSVGGNYSARAAFGWRVADSFYVGPEVQGFADDEYSQFRIGLHLTGLRAANLEWSAAAGYAIDNDARGGAYGRLGVIARR